MSTAARHAKIIGDANYLAHRYDEVADGFRFVHVPRDVHRNCTFITDEHLPNVDRYELISRSDVAELTVPTAPVHFIFHSAYCCSTMMARAFDIPGVSMGLKEPVILNDLIGWRRRGADKQKLMAVLDRSLELLARPMGDDRAVIVKPSNICTPLVIPALKLRPKSKALLLYAPLESYLQSIVKNLGAGCPHRYHERRLCGGRIFDGRTIATHRFAGCSDRLAFAACGIQQDCRDHRKQQDHDAG